MRSVDLIYERDCPNVALARANLRRALEDLGVTQPWQEHLIGDPERPSRVRGYGSPTILVDGVDVAGASPGSEACCRVYATPQGRAGAPSVGQIAAAIRSRSAADQPPPALRRHSAAERKS
jgi:hypothetical protein